MSAHDRARTTRYLRGIGAHASVEPDVHVPGAYVLSIAGAEQSHVDLADPAHVFYAYLRRVANVVDLIASAGSPIRALHLGAGALTLARYIAATRPGSVQAAVELERELLDFVLEQLPLAPGTDLTLHLGDARWELPAVAEQGPFEVIVLDIFSGPEAPGHIAHPDFYREAAGLLSPRGALLVNIGDDPPLTLVRSQLRAMRSAFDEVAVLAEPDMFTARFPGNIVAIGLRAPWPEEWTAALPAAGPHPTRLARGVDLDPLAG
ncbi:fused MFS/spermidine synthase [Sinomonas sp. ASV486]|uniref:spermidine synthase n=1 Tax=Sinomonas sp. ASV486 TaxID=3051170 RepID=UPI0027DB98A8|nr:fused MFS/spermidine synthase [Sinomonas sp. ASV486]MDQ4490666.1 fused MFS/spermidine synthase [Sinomonas sp. ASV486]